MPCSTCGAEFATANSKVTQTRLIDSEVFRERECLHCNTRLWTREVITQKPFLGQGSQTRKLNPSLTDVLFGLTPAPPIKIKFTRRRTPAINIKVIDNSTKK